MADVHHWWKDVFQAAGTTAEWQITRLGEREHYWGFSFRPFQANEPRAEITRHFTSSDNDVNHMDHLEVTVTSGNIYRLSAIWVVGS